MVRRVRRMSGRFKGKLALAILAVALLSAAFGLVFWIYCRNKKNEEVLRSRISELETQLMNGTATTGEIEGVIPERKNWEREIEYSFIDLSSNISDGDYADIRIRYPDGTDYVVVSHKRLTGIDREKGSAVLSVSEEEILLLSSAAHDKKVYVGTDVYTARYTEEPVTEFSVVNYVPSQEIYGQMEGNPNIAERISDTDNSLRSGIEEELKEYKDIDRDGESYEGASNYTETISGLPGEYGGSIWD